MTVLGCSGSVAGPDSAASGYLLTAPDTQPLVIDFGPGVLGALQRYADPGDVALLLSHLHADHCLDVPGLLVWRRYSPNPPQGRTLVYGPSGTAHRLGVASAELPGDVDDVTDTLDVRDLGHGSFTFGALDIRPVRVNHPPEAYGFRITSDTGRVLAYTGDTGMCDAVVELARDADILLSEASWTHAPAERPEGVHLSGTEAGRVAALANVGELLLTHIPPWTSREDVIAEAKAEFSGPVHAVSAGDIYRI